MRVERRTLWAAKLLGGTGAVVWLAATPLVWPSLTTRDLWRWIMIALGLALMAHGLLSKHMRIRDGSTLYGLWWGRVAKKWWQILLMRSLFLVLGICCIAWALNPSFPQ